MRCESCNKRIKKDFSFCPSCGKNFNEHEESIVETVSPLTDSAVSSCSCNSSDCSCENKNSNVSEDDFIKTSSKIRRKSLFYLFAISSVFVFFSFSIALILNKLSVLENKNNDFHSFFYSYVNDSSPVFVDGMKNGHLVFDKHKIFTVNNVSHVEFYLDSYGDPSFNNKSIFELKNGATLSDFTSSLIDNLWSTHMDFSHKHLSNLKISIYINGKLFSYLERSTP